MPSFEILPQLLVNGLIAGSIYALAASGFSLTYNVVKFLNFAQGAVMAISAYAFYFFLSSLGMGYISSAILAIAFSIIAVLLMNFAVYRPLRKRKATNVVTLIASLALLTFFSSLSRALFGSSTKTLPLSHLNRTLDFGIVTITSFQIAIILAAIVIFFLLFLLMKKTKLGKAMRAVSDNKDVAKVVGINPERVYTYTFIIAAVLGSAAGILLGMEQNLYPRMGVLIIVKGFISSVVGGMGSVYGSIIGGIFIGIVENLGIWFLPSGYKDVISFAALLLFLIFKPKGILGVKMRDDA